MVKKMFTQKDRESISQAVAAVETKTSGEIVPMIVAGSHFYGWVHWLGGAIGLLTATLFIYFWNKRGAWPFEWNEVMFAQTISIFLGVGISALPFIKRFMVPRNFKDHAVHEAALANFVANGVHQTKGNTGILIYISLFERQVEILADQGIHQKISDKDFWKIQTDEIVQGIRAGKPSQGLVNAIESMGKILADHFPAQGDNPNELHNDLRG